MRSATKSVGSAQSVGNHERLGQWMEHHGNLSLPEQLHQLDNEPGFRDLPAQTQQRYREHLIQLNNMNPQQRARILERNEALERLTPTQQKLWRTAVQQLSTIDSPRRHVILHAIIDLREQSPEQRVLSLNSANFNAQFSDSERGIIRSILAGETYSPSHPAP